MSKSLFPLPLMWIIPLLTLTIGCNPSPDERLVDVAERSAARQAEQNALIAKQSEQVTQTTSDFLEANTQAREELTKLQRDLALENGQARQQLLEIQNDLLARDTQARSELNELQRESRTEFQKQCATLDQHRTDVETERRQLAVARHRAPIIAAAITQVGLVLAALAPLALCGYLLFVMHRSRDSDEAVTELLIHEIVSERPKLLPRANRPPALPNRSASSSEEEQG